MYNYKIKPSTKAIQFMQICGVPEGLLVPFSLNLPKLLTPITVTKSTNKILSVSQQLKCWDYLQTSVKSYTLIISSIEYYLQARQLATILLWRYIMQALNETKEQALPLWYLPGNEFSNQLLQEYRQGKYIKSKLLIIDNVYYDMPIGKMDKVSDILQTINNRTRIIIYRGENPYIYCLEQLGVKPNYILQLGRNQTTLVKRIKL